VGRYLQSDKLSLEGGLSTFAYALNRPLHSDLNIREVDNVETGSPLFHDLVGDYHTHGAYDPSYYGDDFSPTDMMTNDLNRDIGYLGTPIQQIKRRSGRANCSDICDYDRNYAMISRLTVAFAVVLMPAGCSDRPQACKGLVSAEAMAAWMPVLNAFRAHLAGQTSTTDGGRFLADYRHYDVAVTMSETEFEYEFRPSGAPRTLKGGGAYYRVDRGTGKIEEQKFEK
jgi:hypothetical protein